MHHIFVLPYCRLIILKILQALSEDWIDYFLLQEVNHPGKRIFFEFEVELFLPAYFVHPSHFVDPSLVVICQAFGLKTFLHFLHNLVLSLVIVSAFGHHFGYLQVGEVFIVSMRSASSVFLQVFGLYLFDALGIVKFHCVVFTHSKRIIRKWVLKAIY